MKLSYIALVAVSILTTTRAYIGPDYDYNLKLYVEYLPQNVGEDGYEPVDGKFLQAVRIDPETFLFVLGDADEAVTIQYDTTTDHAYIVVDNAIFYVTTDTYLNLIATSKIRSGVILYAANKAKTVLEYIMVYTPDSSRKSVYSFTPRKNVGDKLGYSKDHYALVGSTDGYDKGALIHYEVIGADTGNGVGILNPSSISAIQPASYSVTLSEVNFGTDVYTTDPPTVPISTGTISDPLESGYLADNFGLRVSESGSSVSTTKSPDSSSSGDTSKRSSGSTQTGTANRFDKTSSSSNTAVNPKSLLKNKANGLSLTGGAGILALFAAIL